MVNLRETKKFWEQRTKEFDAKAPVRLDKGKIYNWLMTREHRKQLKKAIEFCKPKNVLEVGVGQGRLLSKIECISLVGIDVSINMLKKCHIKNNLPNLDLVEAEATHLPFKDDCFDLVYTCTLLLHIPNNFIEAAISEIKRVTDKHIFIIEQLPHFRHLDKPYSEGGYCFPHKYQELFQLPIKYRKRLDTFSHEAILFTKLPH